MTFLLPDIDEKKTKENVAKFFAEEWPIIEMVSGLDYAGIQHMSLERVHSDNRVEDKQLTRMTAQTYYLEVVEAIERLDAVHADVMIKRLVKHLSWASIEELCYFNERQGRTLLNQGLVMFASTFVETADMRVFADCR